MPFELLPLGDRLVLDRVAVSYSPTAATLLRAAPVDPGLQPPWRVQLRAFADPVFASATLDDVTSLQRGLRSAGSEVRQIASQLTGPRDAARPRGRSQGLSARSGRSGRRFSISPPMP